MITISTTTENKTTVEAVVNSVDRLHELVTITTDTLVEKGHKLITVSDGKIECGLDWFDTEPPYRYPKVEFAPERLLALIYDKLDNQQAAFQVLPETDVLHPHLMAATFLKFGYEFTPEALIAASADTHNTAIVHHYGNVQERKNFEELCASYEEAVKTAENQEAQCHTVKHYVNLLIDGGRYQEAMKTVDDFLDETGSVESRMALKIQWCNAKFKGLGMPYNEQELGELADVQKEGIVYLETNDLELNAALLAMDACDVANFLGDFAAAKAHINKAIQYFKAAGVEELLGEAGLKKAHLLYHWSKNGSPQYYKASINAFQDTLKIFKRDNYPEHYAEVQHHLALIYAEIPVADDEKPIWTAFSASAFKEALALYAENKHPYEHAMVCHNYATALMDFPPAKIHDNHKKAYELFEEALKIREAKTYPVERALTLLNQLELMWLMNTATEEETAHYQKMQAKAGEINDLVNDGDLKTKAAEHLKRLQTLRTMIS